MKEIYFKKGEWEGCFEYAQNCRFPFLPEFIQEDDCIVNGRNPHMRDGFDYTTMFYKGKFKAGAKFAVTCSFEEYGAPLITITDEFRTNEQGKKIYGKCYEIVLWEKGLNVWNMFYDEEGTLKWNALLMDDFPLETNKKHEIRFEILEKSLRIIIGDRNLLLRTEHLADEVYVGITGCENINRFYCMSMDAGE